ncbi:hypothetical protein BJY24_000054 [Nocardia transvalensis]|uniref:DUF3558 domain-containing protein n=1 Tax=Nocardia transvalensis TaxID=37333 RepID=A0A7W9P877_9NOCA|nr:hypothetical protein [Nocardia transvalensis]MBB5911187.1 hypothetical protein [Nocardia transvalensis]
MIRRIAVIAALMLTAVACQDDAQNRPAPPAAGAPHADTLNRLRDTDICALLPRAELAALGQVTAVGTDRLYGCQAKIGTDPRAAGRVNWVVRALDDVGMSKGATATVDGMTVSLLGDRDVVSQQEVAGSSIRLCTAYAQLPTGGSMELSVTIPPGAEPCPVAQKMVATALTQWKRAPRVGDSPDTVRTAVTGADPCAVLPKLPTAIPGDTQWVDRCWFRLDDDSVYIEYGHSTDREFENYERVDIAGRQVFRISAGPNIAYKVRVGPTFDPAADDYEFLNVPAVTINGTKQETLERITTEVLALFPGQY